MNFTAYFLPFFFSEEFLVCYSNFFCRNIKKETLNVCGLLNSEDLSTIMIKNYHRNHQISNIHYLTSLLAMKILVLLLSEENFVC